MRIFVQNIYELYYDNFISIMRPFFIILFLFCFRHVVQSQDPHYSQFFSSPLTLNPAFTGKFNGSYRISGNHRNQWPEINNAFVTTTGAIDFHLLKNKVASNNTWGLGFMFLSDNSANAAVKFNYAAVSTAFHKGLDEDGNNSLGIGVQATYSNMLINTSSLKFEDQLQLGGFTGSSHESFAGATLQSSYVDLNAGILFNGSSSERNNYYVGISMYHINKPTQKFNTQDYALNPRTSFQAGTFFLTSDNFGLHFSALHSIQGGITETLIGGTTQFIINSNADAPTSFYAGGWVRLNDAVIPYIGLEFSNARLGMSYDINTSSLKTASISKGGIEISLVYTHQPNSDKPINCPRF